MARVVEQIVAVKLSRIVKDSSSAEDVVSSEIMAGIMESIPQLIESLVDDPAVVVEVVGLE